MEDKFNGPVSDRVPYDWAKDSFFTDPGSVPRSKDEELEEILAVFGREGQQKRIGQPQVDVQRNSTQQPGYNQAPRTSQKNSTQQPGYNQVPRTSQRTSNAGQPRRSSNVDSERYEEMRRKSRTSAPSSNKREKTTGPKKWQVVAVSALVASSLYLGGVMAAPLDSFIGELKNQWLLSQKTDIFVQEIVEPNTTTTFTHDQQIDYGKIAQAIEADGQFTNEELLIAVDALGEVNTNHVLNAAINPPATDVETYMREHNITSTQDWKEKTAQAMYLSENISDTQAELDAIFRSPTSNSTTPTVAENNGTYGGK